MSSISDIDFHAEEELVANEKGRDLMHEMREMKSRMSKMEDSNESMSKKLVRDAITADNKKRTDGIRVVNNYIHGGDILMDCLAAKRFVPTIRNLSLFLNRMATILLDKDRVKLLPEDDKKRILIVGLLIEKRYAEAESLVDEEE
ncbi:hypothetical protein N7495_009708 [Penicillium taxi]|uniref:uncharacterized protein n=1 Tax=Penicillium taxi TaxID=168475 RepID=UPI002545BA00|nr:uncharacterized protein N7495_009708 [Penicillium taxi]KAJ5885198.1 hypothetical protein N7495_009708 [Penicillium taxi]